MVYLFRIQLSILLSHKLFLPTNFKIIFGVRRPKDKVIGWRLELKVDLWNRLYQFNTINLDTLALLSLMFPRVLLIGLSLWYIKLHSTLFKYLWDICSTNLQWIVNYSARGAGILMSYNQIKESYNYFWGQYFAAKRLSDLQE